MGASKQNKQKVKEKLLHKYRLVILNEDTFEERLSFQLSKLNVILLSFITIMLLISGTALLIAFTPIKEFIPGYSSTALKNKATRLTMTVDSLKTVTQRNTAYFNSIRNLMIGKIDSLSLDKTYTLTSPIPVNADTLDFSASGQDSILRAKVEQEDKYSLVERATFNTNFTLFQPVSGQISEPYNAEDKHYAIDIATEKDEPVKATLDGTVIFAEWTAETGFVMILEHKNGILSVYKHNSTLLKEQGDLVTAGEVIAVVGDTGQFSYGPHLHFELWLDGYPVNPADYINFE